jgi:hypothetical protein
MLLEGGGDTLLEPNDVSTTLKNHSFSLNNYLASGLCIGYDLQNKGVNTVDCGVQIN